MSGSEPKGQHIVQRAYLEGFTDPELARRGQRRVWVYLPGKKPLPQSPDAVAIRNYFYCFEREGQLQYSVERGLQQMEDLAFPILQKLRSQNFSLTAGERLTFAGYVALAHSRVPAMHREFDRDASLKAVKRLLSAAENNAIMAAAAKDHEKKTGERVDVAEFRERFKRGSVVVSQGNREYTLNRMFQNVAQLQVLFSRMNWTFLIAPRDDPGFLTSDDPVAVFDPLRGEFGALSFGRDRATFFVFPISRNVCLWAKRDNGVVGLEITSAGVRSVNKSIIERFDSQIYAPFSSMKVRSMVEKREKTRVKRTTTVTMRQGAMVVDES